MHLVEILLPLAASAEGRRAITDVQRVLSDKFGGVTAFTRSPARGLWKRGEGVERDDIVVIEAMVGRLDLPWWRDFREELERKLSEQEIVIRATLIERL